MHNIITDKIHNIVDVLSENGPMYVQEIADEVNLESEDVGVLCATLCAVGLLSYDGECRYSLMSAKPVTPMYTVHAYCRENCDKYVNMSALSLLDAFKQAIAATTDSKLNSFEITCSVTGEKLFYSK